MKKKVLVVVLLTLVAQDGLEPFMNVHEPGKSSPAKPSMGR
jgi:hypothetical protein